ncbi:flagellar biosynthesis repressor FlbT [Methylobacterium sp. Leaf111]|uniref:flagellar biosynthesis repressor FlbT n=1 Tax=Methylobacterium sp. Leaf111 TaxID=1736257 RepID=UPI0006FA1E4E|nr:flagellar biosynthesis repressor FlbT [Methylobacterium sp. Leaf111]KQP70930.1 flagellar biosynthesis repressor FlbT [Methylobacterium sp. Leaf111]
MRLSLRAGERVYVNGAVLRVDRKVSLELLNDATFLLETHVLQAEAATTPLRQLYFAVQALVIDPANADGARELCRTLQAGLLAVVADPEIREGVLGAGRLVEAGRLIEALKLIRGLYAAEAALMAAPSAAPSAALAPVGAAAPVLRAAPVVSPVHPA